MDFHSMKRKELQALCKKHELLAGGTNVDMAERLASHLKKQVVEEPKSKKLRVSVGDQLGGDGKKKGQDLGQTDQIETGAPVRVTRSTKGEQVAPLPKKKLKRGEKEEHVESESQEVGVRATRRGAKKPSVVADMAEDVVSQSEGIQEVGVRVTRRGVKEFPKEGGKKAPAENVESESKGKKATAENVDSESKGKKGTGVETSRSLRNREVSQTGVAENPTKKPGNLRETRNTAKADRNNEVEVGNIDVSKVGTRQTRARKRDNVEGDAPLPVHDVAITENETQQATRRPTRSSAAPSSSSPDKTSRSSRQDSTEIEQKMGAVASRKSDGHNGDKAGDVSVTETRTRQTRARKRGNAERDAPLAVENVTMADTETQIATRGSKRKPIASSNLVVKRQKVSSSAELATGVESERNESKELGVRMTRRVAKELTTVDGKKASPVKSSPGNVDSETKRKEEKSVKTSRNLRNREVLPSRVDVKPTKKASSPRETARAVKDVQSNDPDVGNFAVTKTSPQQAKARKRANVAENVTKKATRRSMHSSVAPTNLSAEKSSWSSRQGRTADGQKKGTDQNRNSDRQNEVGVGDIAVIETSTNKTRSEVKESTKGGRKKGPRVSVMAKNVGSESNANEEMDPGTTRSLSKKKALPTGFDASLTKKASSGKSTMGVKPVQNSAGEDSAAMQRRATKRGKEEVDASLAVENIIVAETETSQATRSSKRKSLAVSNTGTRQTRSRKGGNGEVNAPMPVVNTIFSETGTLQATRSSKHESTAPTNLVADTQNAERGTPLGVENIFGAENINQQGAHSENQSIMPTNEILNVSEDFPAETVDRTSLESNFNSTDECAHFKVNSRDEPEGAVPANNNDDAASLFEETHGKEKEEPMDAEVCGDASNLSVINEGLEDVGDKTEDVIVSEKIRTLLEETSAQEKEKYVVGAEGLMESSPSTRTLLEETSTQEKEKHVDGAGGLLEPTASNGSPETQTGDVGDRTEGLMQSTPSIRTLPEETSALEKQTHVDGAEVLMEFTPANVSPKTQTGDVEDRTKDVTISEKRTLLEETSAQEEEKHGDGAEGLVESILLNVSPETQAGDIVDRTEGVITSKKTWTLFEETSAQEKQKHEDGAEGLMATIPSNVSPETQSEDLRTNTEDAATSEKMRTLLEETRAQEKEKHEDGDEGLTATTPSNVSPETQSEDVRNSTEDVTTSEKKTTLLEETSAQEKENHEDGAEGLMETTPSNVSPKTQAGDVGDGTEVVTTTSNVDGAEGLMGTTLLNVSPETRNAVFESDKETSQRTNRIPFRDASDGSSVFDIEDVAKLPTENRQEINVGNTVEDRQEFFEGNLEQLNAIDLSEEILRKEVIIKPEDGDRVLITVPLSQERRQEMIAESPIFLSYSQERRQEIIVEDRQEDSDGNLEQLNANDPSVDIIAKEYTEDEDKILNTSPSSQAVGPSYIEDEKHLDDESAPEEHVQSLQNFTEECADVDKGLMTETDNIADAILDEHIKAEDFVVENSDRKPSNNREDQDEVPITSFSQADASSTMEENHLVSLSENAACSIEGQDVEMMQQVTKDQLDSKNDYVSEVFKESSDYKAAGNEDEMPSAFSSPEGQNELTTDAVRSGDLAANEEVEHGLSSKAESPKMTVDHDGMVENVEPQSACSRDTSDLVIEEEHVEDCGSGSHQLVEKHKVLEQEHSTSVEVCDTGKKIQEGYESTLKHFGHVEKEDMGCASVAIVEHGGECSDVVGLEEYHDVSDQIGTLVFKETCREQVTGSVSEKPAGEVDDHNIEEEGMSPDRTVQREEDIANAEERVSTLQEDMEEYHDVNDRIGTLVFKETCREQVTGSVSEKPAGEVDHFTEEEGMSPDRTVQREEDIANAEERDRTLQEDMEEVVYQENRTVQNTNDIDECGVLEKSAEKVDDRSTDGADKVNFFDGSEMESMFPDRTVDRKEDVKEDVPNVVVVLGSQQDAEESDYPKDHMSQNINDTDEFCVSDLYVKEACKIQKENACVDNECQPGVRKSVEASSQTVMGSLYGFDASVGNEGNKDDVKPTTNSSVASGFTASGNLFTGADAVNESGMTNPNMTFEDSEASRAGQEVPGDRDEDSSLETEGLVVDTELGENLATVEEDRDLQSLSFNVNLLGKNLNDEAAAAENHPLFGQTHKVGVEVVVTEKEINENSGTTSLPVVSSSTEKAYVSCPSVLVSEEQFTANEGIVQGLHSERTHTHSFGGEEHTTLLPVKFQGIAAHHTADSRRVSQVNLCFGLEEQMFAEGAVDEEEANAEGMVVEDLGDRENHLVHQAEDANDCDIEGSVVEKLGEQEKNMIQEQDSNDYRISVLDYAISDPCENDKESAYVGLENFVDFPEATVGSSLCRSDPPGENAANTRGDVGSKYETLGYEIHDWSDINMPDDTENRDATFVQSRTYGEILEATGISGPICEDRVGDTSNKVENKDQTNAGGPVREDRVENTCNKLENEDQTNVGVHRAL